MQLSAGELAGILTGRLRLGQMPPIGGESEPISSIGVPCRAIQPGSVVFLGQGLQSTNDSELVQAHEAFAMGALGVVSSFPVEPWAGRFTIQVAHAGAALWELAAWAEQLWAGTTIACLGDADTGKLIHQALERSGINCALLECNQPNDVTVPLALAQSDSRDVRVISWNSHCCDINSQLAALCRCQTLLVQATHCDLKKTLAHDSILTLAEQSNVVISLPQSTTHVFDESLRKLVTTAGPSNHFDYYPSAVTERSNGIHLLVASQAFQLKQNQFSDVDHVVAAIAVLRKSGLSLRQISDAWLKPDRSQ